MPTRNKYEWVASHQFDEKLSDRVEEMSASELLSVPGVYDALKEELNNDVLTSLDEWLESTVLEHLTRDDCVALLEGVSIQCYDHEDEETLCEAVKANLGDGTLALADAQAKVTESARIREGLRHALGRDRRV